MSKTSWTDDRVELLKKLWGDGKTASQIAEELGGVTRNAVIGKAHRLNLSKRISPIQTNRKQKANPKIDTPSHVSKGNSISLLELKERSCRWPNGDPKKSDFRRGCPSWSSLLCRTCGSGLPRLNQEIQHPDRRVYRWSGWRKNGWRKLIAL